MAGVAAVAYDHFDSRAGDPQLHTHVVIANKVLTVMDGRWRSLDGRPVFASRTGLSAHYNALLADRLTRDLGIEWELRQRGRRPEPAMGDRRRQRRPDHRVLQPHPRDRTQEGRAHRGVRRPARTDAVSEDHRRAPSPGDARHAPAEGGPIARRPDSRLATARRRAVGDRADGVVATLIGRGGRPADCRRRAAGCDRGDQRRRGRGGGSEAGGVDALEPDGRGVEADHGSEVRDDRGPRGCRRSGRRRGAVALRGPDSAGARDSARPGSSARTARAGSGRGTARSTPRPRCSMPRRGCWLAPRR